MMHLFSEAEYRFPAFSLGRARSSWALIGIGMVAVYFRGSSLLDIDFTGGSSVTFALNDKDKMPLGDVRDALAKTELGREEPAGRRARRKEHRFHRRHQRAIGRRREGSDRQGVRTKAEEVLGRVRRPEGRFRWQLHGHRGEAHRQRRTGI